MQQAMVFVSDPFLPTIFLPWSFSPDAEKLPFISTSAAMPHAYEAQVRRDDICFNAQLQQ